jgi:hypothetical protein
MGTNYYRIPTHEEMLSRQQTLIEVERAMRERDEAIRSARERIEPPNRRYNNKDFKFFRG